MEIKTNKWRIMVNDIIDKHTETTEKSNFHEFYWCDDCYFYDGYDMCCHKKNFGTVTNETTFLCKKLKLYKSEKK